VRSIAAMCQPFLLAQYGCLNVSDELELAGQSGQCYNQARDVRSDGDLGPRVLTTHAAISRSVKHRKYWRATFFRLRGLESYGDFFGASD
jgi:hypothetical protein